jgi:hypothetical protein
MQLAASIIDQRVRALVSSHRARLEEAVGKRLDEPHVRSVAFVVLCAQLTLRLSVEQAIDALTEGSNDFGVDAVCIDESEGISFGVTLFQGKYHHDLEGHRDFPQGGVEKAVQAVRAIFDLAAPCSVNPRLTRQVAEIRARLRAGHIPHIRFALCSNGQPWKVPQAQQSLELAQFDDKVRFEHVSHLRLVRILDAHVPVDDTLRFSGRILLDHVESIRVLIGRVAVGELARLFDAHDTQLVQRNIRRYLGPHNNAVNVGMRRTLESAQRRGRFYFYNNGLTLTCDHFDYNARQSEHPLVHIKNLQLINGAQTAMTIAWVLSSAPSSDVGDEVYVMVRLLQVPQTEEAQRLVEEITFANNTQTPVDLKDLHSNDELQKFLALSIRPLGYEYRRHRSSSELTEFDIPLGEAAEAVLSVWRCQPMRARAQIREGFNQVYDVIFTEQLLGAQVVIAVLLLRFAEQQSRHPPPGAPELVRYGAGFVAMLMGERLLAELGCPLAGLDHLSFAKAHALVLARQAELFAEAAQRLEAAVLDYCRAQLDATQLVELFQRAALLDYLGDERGG